MRAFSKFGDWIKGKKETTVILVGLSGAGKTTLLYKGYFVEELNTIPTAAFNVETIDHNGHRFTVWDMGGEGTCNAVLYGQLTVMQAPSGSVITLHTVSPRTLSYYSCMIAVLMSSKLRPR